MLGKGAKRKLDEDDEGMEGKALAMADGLSKVSYTLQRQTIFNISLMKLYSQRALTEPSLEKRVLINNMLRRIQDELKQEGSLRPLFLPSSPPPDHSVDEGFREAQPAFGVLSVVTPPPVLSQQLQVPPPSPALVSPTPLDACLTPASLLEEDSTVFCTSPSLIHNSPSRPRLYTTTDSFSSALDEIEELCPSSTAAGSITTSSLTVPLPMPLQSSSQPTTASDSKNCTKSSSSKPDGPSVLSVERLITTSTAGTTATEPKGLDSLPTSGLDISTLPSSSSSSSGFLTDLALDDILFADIDTSMYDFDPCTSAAGASSSKLSPVVTADDLIKTLTPNQPFKMDLTELDHIMEVLVGS
ncbi:SERTA domain-containing protein 2 [Bagarius yarrelli]|uniref:SERTA domain-containing protein 2 n=1 Tax=Bagarius yarrelli TaxID=175774 RepID=A0A556TMS7_BAGYA|nr:SERTA domain-containing protein 2 [Bagarius yarrelli]